MIAEFDEAVAELVPEASAGRYEEALANLGTFLASKLNGLRKSMASVLMFFGELIAPSISSLRRSARRIRTILSTRRTTPNSLKPSIGLRPPIPAVRRCESRHFRRQSPTPKHQKPQLLNDRAISFDNGFG